MSDTGVSVQEPDDREPNIAIWWIGTAVAIAVIFAVRCASAYTHPILWGDDWNLFVRFIHAPGIDAAFHPYAGYVSVIPGAIGWVASNFASGTRPFLLAWAAAAIGVASLSWFSSARFDHLLPDVWQRSLVCVLLALVPASNSALLSATMFSSWHILFVLVLATVARAPTRTRWMLIELAVMGLCICSHPLSIVLVPIFCWRAVIAKAPIARWFFVGLSAITCFYFVFGVQSSDVQMRSWGRSAFAAFEMMTHRVVGDTVLHGSWRTAVPATLWGCTLFLLPVIAVTFAAVRCDAAQSRDLRRGLAGVLFLGMAVIIATTLGRFDQYGKLLFSPRYTYVPTLCWCLVAMITILAATRTCAPRLRAIAIVGLVVHTAMLNGGRGYLYRTSPESGDRVVQFTTGIDAWLESAEGEETRSLPLPGRRISVSRPRPGPN